MKLETFLLFLVAASLLAACGGGAALPARTPIPTLIPATLPAPDQGSAVAGTANCNVTAKTLLGAWAASGAQDSAPFDFTDVNGAACEASFADVQQLFTGPNLWYPGALPCASCHSSDVTIASARMDLSSYTGIMAGSRRTSADAKGNDIMGGGNWEQSKLYQMLFILKKMPLGRPANVPADGPTILAGHPKPSP